jgi:hypothetical protein
MTQKRQRTIDVEDGLNDNDDYDYDDDDNDDDDDIINNTDISSTSIAAESLLSINDNIGPAGSLLINLIYNLKNINYELSNDELLYVWQTCFMFHGLIFTQSKWIDKYQKSPIYIKEYSEYINTALPNNNVLKQLLLPSLNNKQTEIVKLILINLMKYQNFIFGFNKTPKEAWQQNRESLVKEFYIVFRNATLDCGNLIY